MEKIKIYPEWNVNIQATIKECFVAVIKIYPEWNVNRDVAFIRKAYETIKIYPEWNVNIASNISNRLND